MKPVTWLLEQKEFKITILAASLVIGSILLFYHAPEPANKEVVAIEKLKQATQAGMDNDWTTLLKRSEDVAGDSSLPDDIRASAFMLIGSYALTHKRLDMALVSFIIVSRKLPGASIEDKRDAERMIAHIHQMTGDNFEPEVIVPNKNADQL